MGGMLCLTLLNYLVVSLSLLACLTAPFFLTGPLDWFSLFVYVLYRSVWFSSASLYSLSYRHTDKLMHCISCIFSIFEILM